MSWKTLCLTATIAGAVLAAWWVSGRNPSSPPSTVSSTGTPSSPERAEPARLLDGLGAAFVENRGQWEGAFLYKARIGPTTVFLEERGWMLTLQRRGPGSDGAALRMRFAGSRDTPRVEAEQERRATFNFLGGEPSRNHVSIPSYASVRYREMYPGIDVKIHGSGRRFEYDLFVAPGTDLSQVEIQIAGAQKVGIDDAGNLVMATPAGTLTQPPPATWEAAASGDATPLPCRYVLRGPDRFGFEVEGRDAAQALVVDPLLLWSTFIGGLVDDCWEDIWDVAVDAAGMVTIVGDVSTSVYPSGFPTTPGAYSSDLALAGDTDLFVMRLDPSQTGPDQLVWSTFLATGYRLLDTGRIALGGDGSVTLGLDVHFHPQYPPLPVTPDAFDGTREEGENLYIMRLNPSGTDISYATFFGGEEAGSFETLKALVVDPSSGVITIAGATSAAGFPTTPGALIEVYPEPTGIAGSGLAGFVARLDPTAAGTAQLLWSTFLDGSSWGTFTGHLGGLAVDANGIVTVSGFTTDPTFPTTPGAYQTSFSGGGSGFVVRLDPGQSGQDQLVWSTFLDVNEWLMTDAEMRLDVSGAVVLAGRVPPASWGYPDPITTPGAFQATAPGGWDMLVLRLDPSLSGQDQLVWSTFVGGSDNDWFIGMDIDPSGAVTLGGYTYSSDFPTTANAFDTTYDGLGDAFVTRLAADGSHLLASTYFGGSESEDWVQSVAVEPGGIAYVGGGTWSSDLPTTSGALQETAGGSYPAIWKGWVARLDLGNSAPGANVAVSPDADATLTFAQVVEPGETVVSFSQTAPALPAGFELGGPAAGGTPTFIEIQTTATFSGSVDLAFHYDESFFTDEASVRLLHYENGDWADITTFLDTTNDIVYGTTTSFSPFAIVARAPTPVAIDIRPGSYPNNVNLGSNGVVPVAILGSSTLDVTTIDPLTVRLASATVRLQGNGSPQANYQDVDQDGHQDLVVHVETSALDLTMTDVQAVLLAKMLGGTVTIRGVDTVRIVP